MYSALCWLCKAQSSTMPSFSTLPEACSIQSVILSSIILSISLQGAIATMTDVERKGVAGIYTKPKVSI